MLGRYKRRQRIAPAQYLWVNGSAQSPHAGLPTPVAPNLALEPEVEPGTGTDHEDNAEEANYMQPPLDYDDRRED